MAAARCRQPRENLFGARTVTTQSKKPQHFPLKPSRANKCTRLRPNWLAYATLTHLVLLFLPIAGCSTTTAQSNASLRIRRQDGSSAAANFTSAAAEAAQGEQLAAEVSRSRQQQQQQTATNNTEQELQLDPDVQNILQANSVIFLVGFAANALVILVILKYTKNASVNDIYILNLAFADIMFISGLVFLVYTMRNGHWVFGNLMCKFYMASTSLNQFASSLLLVSMSFDRFLAVCHPIYAQNFRQLGRAKKICVCIWFICLVLMTPILVFAKVSEEKTCAISWPDRNVFNYELFHTIYSFVLGFLLPLSLIAVSYLCVIRKLRNAANHSHSLGSERRSRSRESTNRRIENLVIVIICTYTICWLPYWIGQLIVSFTPASDIPQGFYISFLIATSLSYTNSALNPLLYAFLSDNFNRRCSKVFSFMLPKFLQRTQCCVETHAVTTTHVAELEPIGRPESRANTSIIVDSQSPQSMAAATPNLHGNRLESRGSIFEQHQHQMQRNRSQSAILNSSSISPLAQSARTSLHDKWPPRGGQQWYNFIVHGDF